MNAAMTPLQQVTLAKLFFRATEAYRGAPPELVASFEQGAAQLRDAYAGLDVHPEEAPGAEIFWAIIGTIGIMTENLEEALKHTGATEEVLRLMNLATNSTVVTTLMAVGVRIGSVPDGMTPEEYIEREAQRAEAAKTLEAEMGEG